ncbi:MAG: hypothetical protein WEE89_16635 [Gemmatimonadota bacterium]
MRRFRKWNRLVIVLAAVFAANAGAALAFPAHAHAQTEIRLISVDHHNGDDCCNAAARECAGACTLHLQCGGMAAAPAPINRRVLPSSNAMTEIRSTAPPLSALHLLESPPPRT